MNPAPAPAETDAAAPLLGLRSVSKTYPGGRVALDGIEAQVARGEFLSLLGPSGCGKSTLLRLIAGLDNPTAGEVRWQGTGAGRIAFVFQEPALMPWADVAENVRLPLKLAGLGRRESAARVRAALDTVGLAAEAATYPRALSGGMRMRVSIARALVTEPSVLLLDEPFAALDEITRFRLNDDLLRLWRERHLTVIFVTHSIFEAVYLSSRILVMGSGRIAAEVPNDLPYPRQAGLRTEPAYGERCRAVQRALAEAAP